MAVFLFRVDLQDGFGWRDISAGVREETVTKKTRLHKKLKPVQDQLAFTMTLDPLIANIILNNPDRVVFVEVYKDAPLWFRGYASPLTGVTVDDEDNQINWKCLDNSYLLQALPTSTAGFSNLKLVDPADKPNSLVHQLLYDAGVPDVDIVITQTVTTNVTSLVAVQDGQSYWDLLTALLFDYTLVFYFGDDGKFRLYDWAPSTITTTATANDQDFVSKLAIRLNDQDFDAVVIEYFNEITYPNRTLHVGQFHVPLNNVVNFTARLYFSDTALTDSGAKIVATLAHELDIANRFYWDGPTEWTNWATVRSPEIVNVQWPLATFAQTVCGGGDWWWAYKFDPAINYADVGICWGTLWQWDVRYRVRANVVIWTTKSVVKEITANSINKTKKFASTTAIGSGQADILAKALVNWLELSRIEYSSALDINNEEYTLGQYVDLSNTAIAISTEARVIEITEKPLTPLKQYKFEGVADLGTLAGVTEDQTWTIPALPVDPVESSLINDVVSPGGVQVVRGDILTPGYEPARSGLYMTADHFGFFVRPDDMFFDPTDGTTVVRPNLGNGAWTVVINNDGTFLFLGDANNKVEWDGFTLSVFGDFFLSGDSELQGTVSTGNGIQSTGYVAGSTGWSINGNGDAEFNDVLVRGALEATLDSTIQGTVRDGDLHSVTWIDELTAGGWEIQVDGDAFFLKDTFVEYILQRGQTASALIFGDIFDPAWTAVQLYRMENNLQDNFGSATRWDETVNQRYYTGDPIFGLYSLGPDLDYQGHLTDYDSGMTLGAADQWTVGWNWRLFDQYSPFRSSEYMEVGGLFLQLSSQEAEDLDGSLHLPASPHTIRTTVNAISHVGFWGNSSGRGILAYRNSGDDTIRAKGTQFTGSSGTWTQSTGDVSLGTSTEDFVAVERIGRSTVYAMVVWFDTVNTKFVANIVRYNGATANPTIQATQDLTGTGLSPSLAYPVRRSLSKVTDDRFLFSWADGTNVHLIDFGVSPGGNAFRATPTEILDENYGTADAVQILRLGDRLLHLFIYENSPEAIVMSRLNLEGEGVAVSVSGSIGATITAMNATDKLFEIFPLTDWVSGLAWVESSDNTIKVQMFGHNPIKGSGPQRSAVQSSGVLSDNALAACRSIDGRIMLWGDGQTTNIEAITGRPVIGNNQKVTAWTVSFGTKTTKAVTNAPVAFAVAEQESIANRLMIDDGTNILAQWAHTGATHFVWNMLRYRNETDAFFDFVTGFDVMISNLLAIESVNTASGANPGNPGTGLPLESKQWSYMRWDGTNLYYGISPNTEQTLAGSASFSTTPLRLDLIVPTRATGGAGLYGYFDELLISEAVDLGQTRMIDHFGMARRWVTLDEVDPIQAGDTVPMVGDFTLVGDFHGLPIPMEAKRGLELATSFSGLTFIDISEGERRDQDDLGDIPRVDWSGLTAAGFLGKDISASWTVGDQNGAMDTGSAPTNGTLHVYVIQRSDTGVVDVLVSDPAATTPGAPVMPTNYDRKRYIGSVRTDGASNLIAWIQHADEFFFKTPIQDVNETPPATTRQTKALSVPDGVRTVAHIVADPSTSSGNPAFYIAPLFTVDAVPVLATASESVSAFTAWRTIVHMEIPIDDSAPNIHYRSSTTTGVTMRITTKGWKDDRLAFTPYHTP